MLDFIENLRQKPEAYRRRFLLLFTVAVTGLIFMVWLSTFNFKSEISDESSRVIDSQLKPVDEIKSNISSFFTTIKDVTSGFLSSSSTESDDKVKH